MRRVGLSPLRPALAVTIVCAASVTAAQMTAALVPAAFMPAAQAAPVSRMTPSFKPNRAGAGTALTLALSFSDPQSDGGVPAPLRHAVIHLPAGLTINLHGTGVCPGSRLQSQLGRGCPASSRLGGGSAHLGAHLGAINLSENAALTAWRGPDQGGHPTLQLLGVGLSPLEEHVVVSGVLQPDRPPYGQQLVLSIPPIPTLTAEPDASLLHSTVTIGAAHGRLGHLIGVPRSCPAHGFAFRGDFTYTQGSSSATATVPCK